MPAGHEKRMAEIRSVMAGYTLNNIYNEDESGLLYRMGSKRTYLGSNENRCDIRGTSFQKYKERLMFVFCSNSDGSQILLIRYIGFAASPVRFRDHSKVKYSYS